MDFKIRIDTVDDEVYPNNPGIYVNFAASMNYIGKMLEAAGEDSYASLFINDNYVVSEMPNPGDALTGKVKNLSADYGLIIYTPMIPIPNSGGVQIYNGNSGNAQNVYVYEYNGKPVDVNLKAAHNGKEINGAEIYYYGLTTRFDATTEIPTMPGVYIAGYTHTEIVYNENNKVNEVRRLGSDSVVIVIKQREANLTITGGTYDYEENVSRFPTISVTDKNGAPIYDAGITVISGAVTTDVVGTSIGVDDLCGSVNIDFPEGLTIPYLPDGTRGNLDDAWNYYRDEFLNKAATDKFTPSDIISFLEFCSRKAEAAGNKAIDEFKKLGTDEFVSGILDEINGSQSGVNIDINNTADKMQGIMDAGKAYFDTLIEKLRPMEQLDGKVWFTFQDLYNMDYSKTGLYLYLGVVTDPDLTVAAAQGVVIINSDSELFVPDTVVPYDGNPQDIMVNETDDLVVMVDRESNTINFFLDEAMFESLKLLLNELVDQVCIHHMKKL
jgi:hypothetical protein